MNKKPEILKPGAKFIMVEDAKGNPQTLFYIHSWSHDGYRWNKESSDWEPISFETSSHVLEKLFFGEFEYETLTLQLASQLFPGSTYNLPVLQED